MAAALQRLPDLARWPLETNDSKAGQSPGLKSPSNGYVNALGFAFAATNNAPANLSYLLSPVFLSFIPPKPAGAWFLRGAEQPQLLFTYTAVGGGSSAPHLWEQTPRRDALRIPKECANWASSWGPVAGGPRLPTTWEAGSLLDAWAATWLFTNARGKEQALEKGFPWRAALPALRERTSCPRWTLCGDRP